MKKSSYIILISGYAFLYIPIIFLIVFSFNNSIFPGIWTGFSLKWYKELFSNYIIWNAVKISIKIAAMSATGAVILGTLGAMALTKLKNFKNTSFFQIITSAPLIMPDIILGISLLLMFVICERLFGIPSKRGMVTIAIAHITLAMAYVLLIVQSRLADFEHSLEEAALDLGARYFQTICHVTIPIIFPAIISSWLLTFAVSLDDVVIANFLTGAQATTLPILIFSNVKTGITPEINALATLLISVMSFITITIGFVLYKKSYTAGSS
ncbi:MAG: ABC transporter permease subunit [Holosporales bacterium]|jgi:putrescine transport system permease protein|nr:ABC transporter permease subunit [Holosporales bacterium]